MNPFWAVGTKVPSNDFGYTIKMATMPIYNIVNTLKIFSRTSRLGAMKLRM